MKFSSPAFWDRIKPLIKDGAGEISGRPGSYPDLLPEALYTPAPDLIAICSHPLIQGTFIDLGTGVGLAPLVYGALHPGLQAIGVEFEGGRVKIGEKIREDLGLLNVSFLHDDLLTCPIPAGDTYFLYFPTGMVLDRILSALYDSQSFFRLVVIESHGDLIPRLKRENWLTIIGEIPLSASRHYENAVIYERLMVPRSPELLPHELSYRDEVLLIEDQEVWLGESLGLEWSGGDRYELKTPPRSIQWMNVKKVLKLSEVPERFHQALELRRRGKLIITTEKRTYEGHIRKIIVFPTFQLEISSGEKVEWEKILTIQEGHALCYESS